MVEGMTTRVNRDWFFQTTTSLFTCSMLIGAYIYFLIILNRWLFTELGVESFGRVWQFYISYTDVGFVRRGFLGTILTITKLNSLIKNEYTFAYCLWAVGGIILTILFFNIIKDAQLSRAAVFGIAFSPSFLAHFGYSTGSFDIILFILLCTAVLNTRRLSVTLLVTVIGILIHELFLFYVPLISAISLASKDEGPAKRNLTPVYLLAASLFVLLTLRVFGSHPMNESQYLSMMATKLPRAAYKHPLWSGYHELYSAASENFSESGQFGRSELSVNALLSLIPTAYATLLAFFCIKNIGKNLFLKTMFAFSIIFPLFASFVAADYLRWICMSADCSLLTMIVFVKEGSITIGKGFSSMLLAFCLFSPFGAARLDWPFPMQQFMFDKLLHFLRDNVHYFSHL